MILSGSLLRVTAAVSAILASSSWLSAHRTMVISRGGSGARPLAAIIRIGMGAAASRGLRADSGNAAMSSDPIMSWLHRRCARG